MSRRYVVIFDRELARSAPRFGLHLRIESPYLNGFELIGTVELPDCSTMPAARAKARELGYEPTHHATIDNGGAFTPMRY